jgi:branched-chain amino acid aminotransferase
MPLTDCKFVWRNGKIVPWEEATVHVSCHGLHYGTGVFEGIRCYNTPLGPAVFRLGSHLDRWFASARVYGMAWSYSRHDLARAVLDVIRANGFHACYIRPIAFYGSHTLSIHPKGCPVEFAILAWPWGSYLGPDALTTGIDVCVSPWRKVSSQAVPARAKACGQYLNSVLAVQDARARGFGEAILLNDDGKLTEGSGKNLFIVRGNDLLTNDLEGPVLPGITRDTVIRLATDLGIAGIVQDLTLRDLLDADEAFLTDTAAEITPIVTVETTTLNILAKFIPEDERILLIEDTAEIHVSQSNLVRFEARQEQNGVRPVVIRDLLKAALRHRPDRILLGEVRGGEAFDLLQLLNTGHSGTLSTIHANSARQGLARFASCVLQSGVDLPYRAIKTNIGDSVNVVVHIERRPGRRFISEVLEINGYNPDADLFDYCAIFQKQEAKP